MFRISDVCLIFDDFGIKPDDTTTLDSLSLLGIHSEAITRFDGDAFPMLASKDFVVRL